LLRQQELAESGPCPAAVAFAPRATRALLPKLGESPHHLLTLRGVHRPANGGGDILKDGSPSGGRPPRGSKTCSSVPNGAFQGPTPSWAR